MGTIRPVRFPTRSTTGFVNWRLPRYESSLPKNSASVPTGSWRARHAWLKNVTRSAPVPSSTSSSTRARPWRVRRVRTASTRASTRDSSPIRMPATSACRVRSM